MTHKRNFSIKEALKFGWSKTFDNFLFFVGLLLLLFSASAIPAIINLFLIDSAILESLIDLLFLVLSFLFYFGMFGLILDLYDGKDISLKNILDYSDLFLRLAIASIFYYILVLLGLLFFVIPGIYLMIRLSFFMYLIIDKDCGALESLSKSYEITKGVTLKIFLFGVLVLLMNVFGAIFLLLGLFITYPITLMATVFIYKEISKEIPEKDQVKESSDGNDLKLNEEEAA